MIQRNISRERCVVLSREETFTAQHAALLISFGYEVEILHSRIEAVKYFVARKPSLVVVESSFLPRFPHRLVQLFKYAHRTPAILLLGKDISEVMAYLYMKDAVYEFVETPLRSEELGLGIKRASERLKVTRSRLFSLDLITQGAMAVPVLGLLLYLLATHFK